MLGWFIDQPRDPLSQAARGWTSFVINGQRFNVPTGATADVWSGVTTLRPLPQSPLAMSVVSTSASDNVSTLLGAKTAVVTFIDGSGDWRVSDLIPLAGLTPVPITYKPAWPLVTDGGLRTLTTAPDGDSTTANIFRINSLSTATAAGQTQSVPYVTNQGILTVVDSATNTVVFEHALAGYGKSLSSSLHVPRNFAAHLTLIIGGTTRGEGTISAVTMDSSGGAYTRFPVFGVDSLSVASLTDGASSAFGPRIDTKLIVTAGSNNIDMTTFAAFRFEPLA